MGFEALATTSAGFAWTLARARQRRSSRRGPRASPADRRRRRRPGERRLRGRLRREPDGVAANVKLAAATGIAGLSIEDSTGDAASRSIPSTSPSSGSGRRGTRSTRAGTGVLLTGRSEGFVVGRPDLDETIRRLRRTRRPARIASTRLDRDDRADPRDRRRGGAEAGEPARPQAVHHGRGRLVARRSAASVSAAPSPVSAGPAFSPPRTRSRPTGTSRGSPTCPVTQTSTRSSVLARGRPEVDAAVGRVAIDLFELDRW